MIRNPRKTVIVEYPFYLENTVRKVIQSSPMGLMPYERRGGETELRTEVKET